MKLPILTPCIRTMHYFTVDLDDITRDEINAFVDADKVVADAMPARAEIKRLLDREMEWDEGSVFYREWEGALGTLWTDDRVRPWSDWMGPSPLHIAVAINPYFWSDLYGELIADDLRWFVVSEDVYPHSNILALLQPLI